MRNQGNITRLMAEEERINTISLEKVSPVVFRGEELGKSQVWHTSLTFERGKKYLVEAASGGGKSSLCSFIYGSRKDYDGKIRFNGQDIRELKISEWQKLRRNNLAYLPQELMLFPELSALENIRLKNDAAHFISGQQIEEWLVKLGIESRRDFPVGKMSVGQQQRVAFIRSLCQPFDFILLDEPVSHLDRDNNLIVSRLVEDVAAKNGAGIISTSVGNPLLLEEAIPIRL